MYLPRTRTRSATHPTTKVSYAHLPSGQSVYGPTTSYSVQGYDGESGSISDNPHKGFKRLINRGELVFGDVDIYQTVREHTDADLHFGPYGKPDPLGWGIRHVWGDLAWWVEDRVTDRANIESDLAHAKTIALIECYKKARESTLLTGEMLSDFGRTVSMVRRPFKASLSLLDQMIRYKNKRLGKTAASAAKATSDAWLEYRYGWKPLILDGEAAIKEASTFTGNLRQRRLVARSSVPFQRTISDTQRVEGGLPQVTAAEVIGTYRHTGSASAGVVYEVKNRTTAEGLLAALGMRPSDMPATLWEVIPFSFVVDWFTNCGSWIRAVTPSPDVTISGSWVTTVHHWNISLNVQAEATLGPSYPYPAVTWKGLNGGSSNRTRTRIIRETNPPITEAPSFRATELSAAQLVDSLALTWQQIMSSCGRFRK